MHACTLGHYTLCRNTAYNNTFNDNSESAPPDPQAAGSAWLSWTRICQPLMGL